MTPTTDHICGPFNRMTSGGVWGEPRWSYHEVCEVPFDSSWEGERFRCSHASCHKLYVMKDGRLAEIKGGIVIPSEAPEDGHSVRGIPLNLMQQPESEVKPCPDIGKKEAERSHQSGCNGAPDVQAGRTRPPTPNPVLPTFANALNDLMQAPPVATPRTDAEREKYKDHRVKGDWVSGAFADILERDLAARDAELERAQNRLGLMGVDYDHCRAELARVTAELDQASKELIAAYEENEGLNVQLAQAFNDTAERANQLAQAQSELETVKRDRDKVSLTAASFADKLTAAQQTIERIRNEVEQYADGAPDATAHDRLANTILGMCPPVVAIAEVRGGQV